MTHLLQFAKVAAPKATAGLLQLGMAFAILRAMGPSEAGVLFVCLTSILVADAVLGSGIDIGVVRLVTAEPDPEGRSPIELQKAALGGKILACLMAFPLIAALQGALGDILFQDRTQGPMILWTLLAFSSLLALRSVQTYFQLGSRFGYYGIAEILHSSIKFGGVGLLLWSGLATPSRILLLYAVGPAMAAGILYFSLARPLVAARFHWAPLWRLLKVARWYLCAAAVGSLTSRMDILLVSSQEGPKVAGIYSAAQALVIIFHMLGTYLSVVLTPKVIPLWKTGRLPSVYWLFQARMAALCLLVFLAAPSALNQFSGLLPEAYGSARPVGLILLVSGLMSLMNTPWTISLLLFSQPKTIFWFDLVAIPILLLLYYKFISRFGAAGAAGVTSAYAISKTIAFQVMAWRTMADPRGWLVVREATAGA